MAVALSFCLRRSQTRRVNPVLRQTVADELALCCPTPVLRHGTLLIKNEGESGLTYGGNKVRKLTALFADLRGRDVTRVLTVGAGGSHHVLATALFAPNSALQCAAGLFVQPFSAHAADVLRVVSTLDITLYPCFSTGDVLRALATEHHGTTAWTGPGAMGACAASGYEAAFEEWIVQRQDLNPDDRFEHHVVAAGSGGTAAGLLTGMVNHRLRGRVVGVGVNHNPVLGLTILAQARGIERRLRRPASGRLRRHLVIDRSAVGPGYGHATPATERAIDTAREVGLQLDHTYTAKAYSVAQRLVREHGDDVVVFWQTLSQRPLARLEGAPAFSDLAPALRRLLPPA